MLDVLHWLADRAVGVQRIDRHIAAVIVGDDQRVPARLDCQMTGRCAVRRLAVEEGQSAGIAVNGKAADLPGLQVLIDGVKDFPIRVKRQE